MDSCNSTSASHLPGLAIICNSVPPYREHVHLRIAREMPQIKTWTICTHEGTDARWEFNPSPEINTISFGRTPGVPDRDGVNWASFRKGGQIINWMSQHNIRAVVVLGYNDVGRLRIIRWCRRNRIPCFVWADANIRLDTHRGAKAALKKAIVSTILSWTSGAFACGAYGWQYFQRYGVPSGHIYHFPNEPDYALIQDASPELIEQTRKKFALDAGRRRIVFSGRLIGLKRVDLLIEAFKSIAAARPQWDLIIVGDGPLREPLAQRVPAELQPRVKWLGFLSDQAEVSRIYRLSDVLALPSDFDQWALVINEAAAAGMAIVSSDVVGATAELVRDHQNGRLFPAGDQQALTECLMDVTREAAIDAMKAASTPILEDWRHRGDPVRGLEKALLEHKVIPAPAQVTGL
jgi:glycosyltransferase involved in cell wall biosynthesis